MLIDIFIVHIIKSTFYEEKQDYYFNIEIISEKHEDIILFYLY